MTFKKQTDTPTVRLSASFIAFQRGWGRRDAWCVSGGVGIGEEAAK